VILVVIAVQTVSTNCLKIQEGRQIATYPLDVAPVIGVINGVGAFHPHHGSILNLSGKDDSKLHAFTDSQVKQLIL
jgi:hypothetical protein